MKSYFCLDDSIDWNQDTNSTSREDLSCYFMPPYHVCHTTGGNSDGRPYIEVNVCEAMKMMTVAGNEIKMRDSYPCLCHLMLKVFCEHLQYLSLL